MKGQCGNIHSHLGKVGREEMPCPVHSLELLKRNPNVGRDRLAFEADTVMEGPHGRRGRRGNSGQVVKQNKTKPSQKAVQECDGLRGLVG